MNNHVYTVPLNNIWAKKLTVQMIGAKKTLLKFEFGAHLPVPMFFIIKSSVFNSPCELAKS